MTDDAQGVAVPLVWDGLDSSEIRFVNQMIVQLGPPGNEGEFIVTLGQLHPPVLIGDADANRTRLEALPYVTVKVVSKIGMSVARARELRDLLDQMLRNYDDLVGDSGDGHGR